MIKAIKKKQTDISKDCLAHFFHQIPLSANEMMSHSDRNIEPRSGFKRRMNRLSNQDMNGEGLNAKE
jgi:uncharacterized protein YllA (UPF0747 family)